MFHISSLRRACGLAAGWLLAGHLLAQPMAAPPMAAPPMAAPPMAAPPMAAPPNLSYYLPADVRYDPAIPTPADYLGYQVGEWHVSHDQLVGYCRALAAASDRVSLTEYGRTYEHRPLLLLAFALPERQAQLEAVRTAHLRALTEDGPYDGPAVVWMGYSVHGNEPSGSNAALLVAYHLAAAQDAATLGYLEQAVVLLDPCLNPDGLQRFATWVNAHKGRHPSPSPADREHREVWPGGRTNHYWFDLNRDWLPLQLPESQGRLGQYHAWRPHILTDHHEMGTNSTFFFQPGVPSRNHPLTPTRTYELTGEIATFHARALDSIGARYYTREDFDDYYFGKGSTYPDLNGAVGILFEQASSRGHAQDSDNGLLTFPFTIRNQVNTSFSTLRAGVALRRELIAHQREFYRTARTRRTADAYVFGSAHDPMRAYRLADVLRQHQIELYRPANALRADGQNFDPATSYVVPLAQPQGRLVEAIFEQRTTFADSLFYDISAWTFPLAFGVPFAKTTLRTPGTRLDTLTPPVGAVVGTTDYAYLLEWPAYYAPRTLQRVLAAGLRAQVATDTFRLEGRAFARGTVLIPATSQPLPADTLATRLRQWAAADGVTIRAVRTGLSATGSSLGSNRFRPLQPPRVAVVVGEGVRSYDAGELWHLLDQHYAVPVTLLESKDLGRTDLSAFNALLLPDGNYAPDAARLRDWVQAGGTLIAFKEMGRWLAEQKLLDAEFVPTPTDTGRVGTYAAARDDRGARVIGGAILSARLDLTHPLAYGYDRADLSVFRSGARVLKPSPSPYAQPLRYTARPLQSGYVADVQQKRLALAPALQTRGLGSGRVIYFSDNPAFRGFWLGTHRLLLNALFFGPVITD